MLPQVIDDGMVPTEPLSILQRRMCKKRNAATVQLLVQWAGSNDNDATWEDYEDFVSKFPTFQF